MMSNLEYSGINFYSLFDSDNTVIVFDDDGINNGDHERTYETEEAISLGINKLIDLYSDKKFIFVYNMSEGWNKYEDEETNYGDDFTGFSSDNSYVKYGVLNTNIGKIKEEGYKINNYFIQNVDNIKLMNTTFFKEIPNSMFSDNFYMIIENKILVYGHMNGGFGFIDIFGKNWELMKEILKNFIDIDGLTWYNNKSGKDYIKEHSINIEVVS